MIVTWDLMLYITIASFMCGFSFKDRRYWLSAIFLIYAVAGVVRIGAGGAA